MQISSRFTIAVHIFACIDTFEKDQKITSDFLSASINVNPVIIRKILSSLKKSGLINVLRGTGGTTIAKTIILEALKKGKHVVTANKALIAHDGQEIFETAAKYHAKIYYEAAVGGGIPVVVPAKEDLIANEIEKIEGILNGTTNFILTLMETDNLDFQEALTIADGLGYVEADASLDLDGIDAAHKICILTVIVIQN